jgi:hypothetical protein
MRTKIFTYKKGMKPGVVAHAFNLSTQEAEAGGFLSLRPAWSTKWVPGDGQSYTEKPCLEKPKKKKKKKIPNEIKARHASIYRLSGRISSSRLAFKTNSVWPLPREMAYRRCFSFTCSGPSTIHYWRPSSHHSQLSVTTVPGNPRPSDLQAYWTNMHIHV